MIGQALEKLAAAGIELVPAPAMARHIVFTRDGFVSLVERREDGFGAIGSAGLATRHGFAALAWRDGDPFFVARGFEQTATAEQVARLRAFESDLRAALA
jgi:hypothetical protein